MRTLMCRANIPSRVTAKTGSPKKNPGSGPRRQMASPLPLDARVAILEKASDVAWNCLGEYCPNFSPNKGTERTGKAAEACRFLGAAEKDGPCRRQVRFVIIICKLSKAFLERH